MVRNLKDAFYNAQFRVGQGIYTRAVSQGAAGSLTQANFESFDTFTNLVDDASVMNEFAGSQLLMEDVSKSSKGMETVASSQTAMDAVAASQTAMDAVAASQTAMDAVAASQTAMDAVVASQTAMDAVAASQTAMDAVAASQTARDVIGFSGLAYDTIANSNMAIGKYAIGYTTESPSDFADMETVASSQTAMDAVAASQTAMDAVVASLIGRTTILESQYVIGSLWSNSTGSTEYWNGYTNQVETVGSKNEFDIQLVSNDIGGQDLQIENLGDDSNTEDSEDLGVAHRSYSLDLTNYSQLNVVTSQSDSESSTPLVVRIDGINILEISSNHSTVTRNIDVSSYSGETEVILGLDYQGLTFSTCITQFSRLELIE